MIFLRITVVLYQQFVEVFMNFWFAIQPQANWRFKPKKKKKKKKKKK
jgi:hypothetical protein